LQLKGCRDIYKTHDEIVGGLRFYRDFLSFFLSSAIQRVHWTKLNQKRPRARKWVRLKMHVQNLGYPLSLWVKNHVFRRLYN